MPIETLDDQTNILYLQEQEKRGLKIHFQSFFRAGNSIQWSYLNIF